MYTAIKSTSYTYDSANQLVREDNEKEGKTWTWTYDNGGNITCRREYAYTDAQSLESAQILNETVYKYGKDGWGDLLTRKIQTISNGVVIANATDENAGIQIETDTIGNTTDDGTWTYTWQHGRELASMSDKSTAAKWDFTYNANGMRTKRVSTDKEYTYVYDGSNLVRMTVDGQRVMISYTPDGTPLSIHYNGYLYYYVTNAQGDVVALVNGSQEAAVEYRYDAWGNILDITGRAKDTIGEINPLRYRGYVYDSDTGLYYLQSRYYNPEMGRFINADGLISTGQGLVGNNMFAYCNNNPVLLVDSEGTRPIVGASIQNETELERNQSFNYMNGRSGKHSSQIDLTPDLDNFMQDNAKTLSDYYNKYGFALSFLYFVMSVNDFGPLDIKRQSDWAFDEGTTYYYRGVELRYDDPGNINYGYLGASLFHSAGVSPTISLEILNLGGGGKQVLNHGFTYGNIYTYFDDPRDYNMIRFGFSLYTGG